MPPITTGAPFGPKGCPWFLWSNHPNYTPPLHILLVDDKWVQYTWVERLVFSANRSFQHPKKASSNHLLKNFQMFFQVSADFGCWWGIGGNDFLFGSVRVTNPNCWCFILFVFSAWKASGVLKNPIPVLPWSHYSCTFFKMSSFEQKSFHKNQHESSPSVTIFCWDDLMIFQKSPPFHGFLRFFQQEKSSSQNGQILSPPNSSDFTPLRKVKLLWLFGPIARFQFIDQ